MIMPTAPRIVREFPPASTIFGVFRRSSIFFTAILGFILEVNACRVKATYLDRQNHRVLVFDNKSVSLGSIDKGEVVPVRFQFRNISDGPVRIVGINVGCGCTSVKKAPKEIGSGERGVIELAFNTSSLEEAVQKTLEVVYTDGIEGTTELLKIEARILPERGLAAEPPMLDFGRVYSGSSLSCDVKLTAHTGQSLPLQAIGATGAPWMRFELNAVQGDAVRQILKVKGIPPIVSGPFEGKIQVATAKGPGHVLTIPFRGVVDSSLSSDPPAMIYAGTKTAGTIGRATIRNSSAEALGSYTVMVESESPDDFEVEAIQSPDKSTIVVTLRLKDPGKPTPAEGAVMIDTRFTGRREIIRVPFLICITK